MADTGNPFALVIAEEHLRALFLRGGANVNTNFGFLQAVWLPLSMPELGSTP